MDNTSDVPQERDYRDEAAKLGLVGGSRLPLSHQEKAVAELHENINQLANRLKPILTPVNETSERTATDEAKEVASPLADQLNANNRGIRRASESIRGLMNRIEC